MTIVIFNTITEEVIFSQGGDAGTILPEFYGNILFGKKNLDPNDYTCRRIEGDFTLGLFKRQKHIKNGIILDKTDNPVALDKATVTADGVDYITLSNLPDPCDVKLADTTYNITGGTGEFTFDLEGIYSLSIVHPEHNPWGVTINAI